VKVVFYKTAGGASPVERYLEELDARERAAVADTLTTIETSGLSGAGVRTRQIKGKLWEIKASQQRVFFVSSWRVATWCCFTPQRRKARRPPESICRRPRLVFAMSREGGPEGPTEWT